MQARDELRINFAVRVRSNIQQQVGIVASGAYQFPFQVCGTLVVAVSDVESPCTVERVGTLQRNVGAHILRIKAGSILTGEIAFEGLYILAGLGRLMMVGNDEGRGL